MILTGRSERTSLHAFSLIPKKLTLQLYEAYKLDFLVGGYPYPKKYIQRGKES